jgi:hypothetical protein
MSMAGSDPLADELLQFVNRMYTQLTTLRDDLVLVEEEVVKLHYALDFAEVYALTYPLGHHIQPMLGEDEYQTFRRELVTLAFIFGKRKEKLLSTTTSLILLPPYIEEMRITLGLIKYRIITVTFLANLARRARDLAFSPQAFTNEIRGIVDRYINERKEPTQAECDVIMNYIGRNYPDFFAAVLASSYNGAALLNKFLSDGTLQTAKRYFRKLQESGALIDLPEIERTLQDSEINKGMEKYLPSFLAIPTRKDKDLPNRVDAAACGIIKRMNDSLSRTRNVLLFISHSLAMNKVVEPIVISKKTGELVTIGGCRDLDYFWLYYAHKDDNRSVMIQDINRVLRILASFKETGNHLDEVKQQMEFYSNVSFAATTDENVKALIGDVSPGSIGNKFLRLVEQEVIRSALDRGKTRAQEYLEKLIQSIDTADKL